MRPWVFSGYLLVLIAACGVAWAAPELRMTAPPKTADTASVFVYEINLEWPSEEGNYEVLASAPSFENLTVVDQSQSREVTGATSRLILSFALQGSRKGEAGIASFEIRYRLGAEGEWKTLPVPAQRIMITGAFPGKPVLGGTALLSLLFFVSFFIRKWWLSRCNRERLKHLPPPDPKQRIYAGAEETILTYKGETQRDTITHWASAVKQAVMAYYELSIPTATESDVLKALESRLLGREELGEISAILLQIEALKYTGQTLSVREMESLQKTLLQYVRGKIIIENPSR